MVPAKSIVRLITYSEEIFNGEPLYVSSNGLPEKALKYEPAGHAFHDAAMRLRGYFEEEKKEEEIEERKEAAEEEEQYIPSSGSYRTKSKKKSGTESKEQDHYALLNLNHLRYLATEDQIRKSYRDTALKYHPDKQAALLLLEKTEAGKQAKKEEIETHFKAVQEAYEVLIDPAKRRIFDSTDEFDDAIPTDCASHDFYKVFGPVFMRNGRWSVAQPVPSLGDDNTDLKEVDEFYSFWYSFKSWREFPQEDEYDLEEAESREHKRWMERQNAKLSEKARKEENVRIRCLVDNAYKRDPRILRRKELEKAEKQKKRQAKFLAKKLEDEKAAKEAEEEKRRKEEEDKQAAEVIALQKKAKEKERKLLQKARGRLRTLSASVVSHPLLHNVSPVDIEDLCLSLGTNDLKNLCDKMDGKEVNDQAETLRSILGRKASTENVSKDEKTPPYQNGFATQNGTLQKPVLEKGKPMPSIQSPLPTRDDIVNAAKAPSAPVNSSQKPKQATANGGQKSSDLDQWSTDQEQALIQALKKFPKEANQRWKRVASAVPGKTMNQCKQKATLMEQSFRTKKT